MNLFTFAQEGVNVAGIRTHTHTRISIKKVILLLSKYQIFKHVFYIYYIKFIVYK